MFFLRWTLSLALFVEFYAGHSELRRAYVAHLHRCVDDGGDVAWVLRIGLNVNPGCFPEHGCIVGFSCVRRESHVTDVNVHCLYLGHGPDTRETRFTPCR